MNNSVMDDALVNLLQSLPPQVAERVRIKYEEDRSDFLNYVTQITPSKDAIYWAKPSCTKCHGRGIIGTLTKPSREQKVLTCSCTSKTYAKWMIEARRLYNATKEQGHEKKTTD